MFGEELCDVLLQTSQEVAARVFLDTKSIVEDKLLEMARTLERHCLKRVNGGLIKKAPSCTKGDLLLPLEHL